MPFIIPTPPTDQQSVTERYHQVSLDMKKVLNYCHWENTRVLQLTQLLSKLLWLLAVPRSENPLIPQQLPRWQRPPFSTNSDRNFQLLQNFKAGKLECFVSIPAEKSIWVICDDTQNPFWNEQSLLTKVKEGGSCCGSHEKSTSKTQNSSFKISKNGSCDALSSAQSSSYNYHQTWHTVVHSTGKRLDRH